LGTLDFTELDKKPPGEAFEALVRLIGERQGLKVQWSGRGADGGRDLMFTETLRGTISTRSVKWLVNCKDHSDSGASVSEREIGSILDKVAQHQCDGFLIATTTTVSTGLKARLDQLDIAAGGKIHTKVWDRFEITAILSDGAYANVRRHFFPKQAARDAVQTIDAARRTLEASLPRVTAGILREKLVPRSERLANLDGARIWPVDRDQRKIIDLLKVRLTVRVGIGAAIDLLGELHFDAFIAFMDALIRNFPSEARSLLAAAAEESSDSGFLFNAIEILREYDDFTRYDEYKIARKCDGDTLTEMYGDFVKDALMNYSKFDDDLPSTIVQFDNDVIIDSVSVGNAYLTSSGSIDFCADITFGVRGDSPNPERRPTGQAFFDCTIRGHLSGNGIEIERISDNWAGIDR